ncbi:MAG: hypothetical protein KGY69_15895 [Bacteroidales bacterium]|nr:hypothetical protein [Bacteroidales bacterium]
MENKDKVVNKPKVLNIFAQKKAKTALTLPGIGLFKYAMNFRGYFSGKNQENKFEEGTSFY